MAIIERPPGGLVRAPLPTEAPEPHDVARFDIRLPWPLGPSFLVAGIVGAIFFALAIGAIGQPIYHGEMQLLVIKMGRTGSSGVQIVDRRVSAIAAIARSDPFLIELKRESGVEATVEELSHIVDATRPKLGVVVAVTVNGTDAAQVEELTQHLPTALSATIDRYRAGLIPLLNESGRDLAPGLNADGDGPLYLQLFDQPSIPSQAISSTSPRVALGGVLGFGCGVLGLAIAAGVLHERARISSREDIEELLDVDQIGTIPRPRGKGGSHAGRMMLGFANEVASLQTSDQYSVGVIGAGTSRLLARTARTLAAATAAVGGTSVVFVDLRERPRRPWRRGQGVLDLADADDEALDAACRPLPRWTLPRWAWRFGRGVPLRQLGLGRVRPEVDIEGAMASAVVRLAAANTVVVALPRVPGPTPVGSTLAVLDVGLLTLLDGWTGLEEARVVADATEAGVPGAVRFVVIEN